MLHLIHPALVHFSVAFLVVGGLCEAWAHWTDSERIERFGAPLVGIGLISMLPTVASGYLAANTALMNDGAPLRATLDRHEQIGWVVLFVFVAALFWKGWSRGRIDGPQRRVYALLMLVAVALVAYEAFLGGTLVYEFGIGIIGR